MQELAVREAAGESFWTDEFDSRARTRIMHLVMRTVDTFRRFSPGELFDNARRLIMEQEGVVTLMGGGSPYEDFASYFTNCPHDMFPTALEALIVSLEGLDNAQQNLGNYPGGYAAYFASELKEILTQERVGWDVIEGQMLEIKSKELHTAVVAPTLRLLHESGFSKADKQYRDALDELAQGKAADAITDAGAALQEVLEALGCQGNQLGDLIRSAKKRQMLGAHDTPMLDAIERVLHWVAADRSEMGDAHHSTAATREDAWLIVHVVGALIVRLASGQSRRK